MDPASFEKVFPADRIGKRERVERTLGHRPVDRAALHEQLSYNGPVIGAVTGREITGFDYTPEDVGQAIRLTLDSCFPIFTDKGTETVTTADGFVMKNERWTTWRIARPFDDERRAAAWLERRMAEMVETGFNDHTAVKVDGGRYETAGRRFNAGEARDEYHAMMNGLQRLVGETVIIDFSFTGFCDLFDAMGLEIFTFFALDHPDLLEEYLQVAIANELSRVHAVADPVLSPVVLIPEDFATKHGPIFRPDFLERFHFPYVQRLVAAWHSHGLSVLYHSDGNYGSVIPQLMACGVDGFYCLEPACGMDIVECSRRWPRMVWSGGLDGVELMEHGTPRQVKEEVRRQITQTGLLNKGGVFIATTSEINPTIPPGNFHAMVEAVGDQPNPDFR
jgi:hypothetical protein